MARGAGQKLRPLHLAKILQERSDEDHPLTVQDLIAALEAQGIGAERKTIYDDVEALEQMGLDIVTVRGRSNAYYIGERAFQLAELKLLVDVVQSAKFITPKKSGQLIKKLGELGSRHQARQLERQVYVTGRTKAANEGIYYNVDAIQQALVEDKQVAFRYYEWAVDKSYPRLFDKRYRRGGKPYQVSPWALTWDDENYYLIAYDAGSGDIRHYRVDKMAGIHLVQQPRDGKEQYAGFDIARYTRMTFGMFHGQATDVRLRFSNRLIGVVVDRFGSDITIHPAGEGAFTVRVEVADSPQFFAWLLSFGGEAELLSPEPMRAKLRDQLAQIQKMYAGG